MISGTGAENAQYMWAGQMIPIVDTYKYLGVMFTKSGSWKEHVDGVIAKGKQRLHRLEKFLHIKSVSCELKHRVIMAVLVPLLEYGSEVWRATKEQTKDLDRIVIRAARYALGCGKGVPSTAVQGEMGIHTMGARFDINKLVFRGHVQNLEDERYPKQILRAKWGKSQLKGGQPMMWEKFTQTLMGEFSLTEEQLGMNKRQDISDSVWAQELDNHIKNIRHDPNTRTFYGINSSMEMQPYLSGKFSAGKLAKLYMRTGGFGAPGKRASDETKCPCCDTGALSTSVHLLMDCPKTAVVRMQMEEDLRKVCPEQYTNWCSLPDTKRFVVLMQDGYWKEVGGQVGAVVKTACLRLWNMWKSCISASASTSASGSASRREVNGRSDYGKVR
jgi:hypothetical protein